MQNIYAWLGPAISQESLVSKEIFDQFIQKDSDNLNAFKKSGKEPSGKYL